ncbi:MAG TPA: polymer-forming cytoskeletal protein [Candidatus Methylomirabilis sp.]|nr:polymer-forming cytoskeletal protein [Candidatus Methylomirabilis sp.]
MSAATVIGALMFTVSLFLGGPSEADEPSGGTRLEGRLPDNAPVVSLDQTRGTILDALDAISKQAGVGLVVTAPEDAISRPLAIRISHRPAAEALQLVLEAGSLRATVEAGVLKVRPDTLPREPRSERVRRRGERGRDRLAERAAFGQSLRIEADENVVNATAIGGSLTVLGRVRGNAVAMGGSVTLLPGARVEGDAVAIGGSVHLAPGTRVEGNGVAVGGTVTVEEGAFLAGDNVGLGGALPRIVGSVISSVVGGGTHVRGHFGLVARLARGVLLLGIAVLVALIFPTQIARVRTFMTSRPGLSSLGGLAVFLGFMPLCVLLAVTIIGIPLIPIAAMTLVAILVFSVTVSALWLGERVPSLREGATPLKAVALGAAILAVVGLIPWIGTAAIVAATLVAAGATLLSRFGRRVAARA